MRYEWSSQKAENQIYSNWSHTQNIHFQLILAGNTNNLYKSGMFYETCIFYHFYDHWLQLRAAWVWCNPTYSEYWVESLSPQQVPMLGGCYQEKPAQLNPCPRMNEVAHTYIYLVVCNYWMQVVDVESSISWCASVSVNLNKMFDISDMRQSGGFLLKYVHHGYHTLSLSLSYWDVDQKLELMWNTDNDQHWSELMKINDSSGGWCTAACIFSLIHQFIRSHCTGDKHLPSENFPLFTHQFRLFANSNNESLRLFYERLFVFCKLMQNPCKIFAKCQIED